MLGSLRFSQFLFGEQCLLCHFLPPCPRRNTGYEWPPFDIVLHVSDFERIFPKQIRSTCINMNDCISFSAMGEMTLLHLNLPQLELDQLSIICKNDGLFYHFYPIFKLLYLIRWTVESSIHFHVEDFCMPYKHSTSKRRYYNKDCDDK